MKKIILNTPRDWIDWADARSMPEPNTGCHLWTGSLNDKQRPTASVGGSFGNAFRLLWEGVNGPIPEGIYLCHRCDNPSCVNLGHGFLGTPSDNAKDCASKGRQWLHNLDGFANPNAKITPELLAHFRAVYRPRHPQFGLSALSRQHGIGRNMIAAAMRGHSFKSDRAIEACDD
jgi:hypothetical protein